MQPCHWYQAGPCRVPGHKGLSVSPIYFSFCCCCCCYSVPQSCPILCDPMDCIYQDFLSFTISWSLLKFRSIASVMSSDHQTISSSVFPSSSCHQSFPASGSFLMSQLVTSGGQRIGASASASVLPMNIQGWFPLGLTGFISLLSKGLSRVFSSTTVWKFVFFSSVSQSCLTLCDPHGLQHVRLPCPSPTPGTCSNSCSSSWWCHPTFSSSSIPFSSCLQSFPASGSFQMSQFFAQVAKILEFHLQHQSLKWIFRTDFL